MKSLLIGFFVVVSGLNVFANNSKDTAYKATGLEVAYKEVCPNDPTDCFGESATKSNVEYKEILSQRTTAIVNGHKQTKVVLQPQAGDYRPDSRLQNIQIVTVTLKTEEKFNQSGVEKFPATINVQFGGRENEEQRFKEIQSTCFTQQSGAMDCLGQVEGQSSYHLIVY